MHKKFLISYFNYNITLSFTQIISLFSNHFYFPYTNDKMRAKYKNNEELL